MQRSYKRSRKCLPGFPRIAPFQNREELEAYFSNDKIQCLTCGRFYRSLAWHIQSVHEIDPDEYRAKYGIPYTYGLISKTFLKVCIRRRNDLVRKGLFQPPPIDLKKIQTPKHRKTSSVILNEHAARMIIEGHKKRKYTHQTFEETLNYMQATACTLIDACKKCGLPDNTMFDKYCRSNKDFQNRYHKIALIVKSQHNICGYPGISWDKDRNRYRARYNRKMLGRFINKQDAIDCLLAYKNQRKLFK